MSESEKINADKEAYTAMLKVTTRLETLDLCGEEESQSTNASNFRRAVRTCFGAESHQVVPCILYASVEGVDGSPDEEIVD